METASSLPFRSNGRRGRRALGIGIVSLGALLLVAGGGYSLYSWSADRDLERLVYKPAVDTSGGGVNVLTAPTQPPVAETDASTANPPATDPQVTDPPATSPDIASNGPLPQTGISYEFPPVPRGDDDDDLVEEVPLANGFLPLTLGELGALGTLTPATRLRIPAINLEADISELAILDLGDSRAYEAPKDVVGHTPKSANPGELGNVWLFGHLESLIRGEGSIFRKLPLIPKLLKQRQRVYVYLETPQGEYVYQAVETDVLHKSEMTLYQKQQPSVTLVTCVPRLVYDHRLLVTTSLVGFKPAGS